MFVQSAICSFIICHLLAVSPNFAVRVTLEDGKQTKVDKKVVVSSPVLMACAYSAHLPNVATSAEVDWIYHKSLTEEENIVRSGVVGSTFSSRFSFNPPASLQLSETVVADTGTYECKVTILNDSPNTGKGFYNLTILVPPSKPTCRYTNGFELTLGYREEFLCSSASGIPRPTYTWFKDGQPLPTDGKADKRYQNTSFTYSYETGKIVFSKVTPLDEGTYYCEATNEVASEDCAAAAIGTKNPDYMWLIGVGVGCLCGVVLIGIGCYLLYRKGYCADCCSVPEAKRRHEQDDVALDYLHDESKPGRATSEYSGYSAGKRSEPISELDGGGRTLNEQREFSRYSKERLMDAPSEHGSSYSRSRHPESSRDDDYKDRRNDERRDHHRDRKYDRDRPMDVSSEYSSHSRRPDRPVDVTSEYSSHSRRPEAPRDDYRYNRDRRLEDQREYSRYSRERLVDEPSESGRDRRLEDQREYSRYSRERLDDAPSEYSNNSRRPMLPPGQRRHSLEHQLDASSDYSSSRGYDQAARPNPNRYSMPLIDNSGDSYNKYGPQGGVRVMP